MKKRIWEASGIRNVCFAVVVCLFVCPVYLHLSVCFLWRVCGVLHVWCCITGVEYAGTQSVWASVYRTIFFMLLLRALSDTDMSASVCVRCVGVGVGGLRRKHCIICCRTTFPHFSLRPPPIPMSKTIIPLGYFGNFLNGTFTPLCVFSRLSSSPCIKLFPPFLFFLRLLHPPIC